MAGMSSDGYPQRRFALPPDATEVILLRHGASAPALPGVSFPMLDGHGDPPLAPSGEEQAAQAAARLRDEELNGLFVTGLMRTLQTAAPLAAALGVAPVHVPALREVRLGEWEGGEFRIRVHEGDPIAMRMLAEERWDIVPGAEASEDFSARVRAGMAEVVAAIGPGRSGVAVVHGGVIGEICRAATSSRPFAFVHSDNCSITRVVVFDDGRWMLRSFNDTTHLS